MKQSIVASLIPTCQCSVGFDARKKRFNDADTSAPPNEISISGLKSSTLVSKASDFFSILVNVASGLWILLPLKLRLAKPSAIMQTFGIPARIPIALLSLADGGLNPATIRTFLPHICFTSSRTVSLGIMSGTCRISIFLNTSSAVVSVSVVSGALREMLICTGPLRPDVAHSNASFIRRFTYHCSSLLTASPLKL